MISSGVIFQFRSVDVITAPRGFCSVWLLFLTRMLSDSSVWLQVQPFLDHLWSCWGQGETVHLYSLLEKELWFYMDVIEVFFFRFDCSLDVVNLGISLCHQTLLCAVSYLLWCWYVFFFFVRKEKLLNANSGLLLEWSQLTALMKWVQATEVVF